MIEKNQSYKVTETSKVKAKICARCVMRVGSNNWIRHWKQIHKIHRRVQMKEYVDFDPIPEPFFLSKPYQKNKYVFEEPGDHVLKGDMVDVAAKVLARFM